MSDYTRPTNTTANPNWMHAPDAQQLIPYFEDPSGDVDRFVQLVGNFLLTQGPMAGKPFSDAWLPWQKDALRLMYQSRQTMLICGKGSGKSTMIAAFCVAYTMWLAARGEATRGLIAVLASSVSTAGIVWSHIVEGVLADPELRPLWRTNVQSRTLVHISSGISVTILSPSLDQAVGRRPIVLITDELAVLAEQKDATAILNQLRQGGRNFGAAFRDIVITTMPIDEPRGEMDRLLKYARAVRDGKIEDQSFAPVLYTFPVTERPDLDPMDDANWWRGMPSLRTSEQPGTMDATEFRSELSQAAAAEDAGQLSLLLSQRLGIQASLRADLGAPVIQQLWASCPEIAAGSARPFGTMAVGIDVGGLDDPAAMACVVRADGGEHFIYVRQYLTRAGYDRTKGSTRAVYDEAIASGHLTIVHSVTEVEQQLFRACITLMRAGCLLFGGDMYRGQAGFGTRFSSEVAQFQSVPTRDYLMGAALSQVESLMQDGKLHHEADPLLTFNVQNLAIDSNDSGGRRVRKKDAGLSGQGFEKIDGVMAVLYAIKLISEVGQWEADALIG